MNSSEGWQKNCRGCQCCYPAAQTDGWWEACFYCCSLVAQSSAIKTPISERLRWGRSEGGGGVTAQESLWEQENTRFSPRYY